MSGSLVFKLPLARSRTNSQSIAPSSDPRRRHKDAQCDFNYALAVIALSRQLAYLTTVHLSHLKPIMAVNRWLVAFACAWINLFIFAVFRSAGVLYLSIIETFQCTYQQSAWPVSMAGSVASLTGLAAGFLSHHFSIRALAILGVFICSISLMVTYFATSIEFVTLTVGLVQGIGIGLVTNLLPAILNAHFREKKAIALGISYAGATLGAFIFPVLIQSLLENYKFHNTILFIGGITLNGILGGVLLCKPKSSKPKEAVNEQPSTQQQNYALEPLIGECDTIVYVDNNKLYENITQKDSPVPPSYLQAGPSNGTCTAPEIANTRQAASVLSKIMGNLKGDLGLLVNWHFVLCTFTYVSFILDFVAFIIILPDVARAQGIADVDSRWLLSIFSLTDFVGRISPGWFSHWKLITDKSTYILSISLMGLCMILLNSAHTWLHFVLLSLVCGLVTGCQMVLSPAILADYLGAENTAVAFGMANFLCGLFTLVTRPLIIGMKDIYGNYNLLGYILSGTALLSGAIWAIEIVFTSRRKNRPNESEHINK